MTTNNKMELTGAIEALSRLQRHARSRVDLHRLHLRHPGHRAVGARLEASRLEDGRGHRRAEPGLVGAAVDDLACGARPRAAIAWHYVRGPRGHSRERAGRTRSPTRSRTQKPVDAVHRPACPGTPYPLSNLPDDTTVPARRELWPEPQRESQRPLPTHTSASSTARRCAMRPGVECERRVKGRSGARFKKATSAADGGGDPPIVGPRSPTTCDRRAQHIFMTLRKILFWCHLAAGVTAGAVILIMSVTGVLLTLPSGRSRGGPTRGTTLSSRHSRDAPRRSIENLIVGVHEAEPRGTFTTMTVRADPLAPVAFAAADRTVYVSPYTGDVMGNGSPRTRRFSAR